MNYSPLASGNTAVAMTTKIWWGEISFGATMVKDDRLGRVATVKVMSYQEAGEL
jgi:hypothetical protein